MVTEPPEGNEPPAAAEPPQGNATETTHQTENPQATNQENTTVEPPSTENQTFPNDRQNEAFARIRRENEQYQQQISEMQRFRDTIAEIGAARGMTPEQVLESYEQARLQQQAQETGVPVEHLQRLQQVETQLETQQYQQLQSETQNQLVALQQKYSLSNEDMSAFIDTAQQQGFDPRFAPVEAYYLMLNQENITKRAVEQARQADLEAEKQRQLTTPIANKGGAAATPTMDEEVEAFMQKHDLYIG
ncbi:hypothetical protein [Bacillus thuringiensis]|uniref:hypothetical protein n=1 Tax=Bacillus thuringiensis TaxID=1428 RepID=UPI0011456E34|nr:hypothetical protein [Bacillus thuringiensis]